MPLQNPYQDEKKSGQCVKTHVRIPIPDFQVLRCIKPIRGNTEDVLAFLVHALVTECRRQGITEYHQYEDYVKLVTSIRFSDVRPLGRGTVAGTNGQTPVPNDRGGVENPSYPVAHSTQLGDSPQGSVVGGSGHPHGETSPEGKRAKGGPKTT